MRTSSPWLMRVVLLGALVGAGCGSDGSDGTGGAAGAGGGAAGAGGMGPTTSSLTQNGITWQFGEEVEYGTFANGDYWVHGPVTIVQTTPEVQVEVQDLGDQICVGGYTSRDCTDACEAQYPGTAALCSGGGEPESAGTCFCIVGRNGWQSNPRAGRVTSAFDSRVGHHAFDHRLIPTVPYVAQPGESLVKGASKEEGLQDPRPSLSTASVLTVVAEPPPDGGAAVFRPPYVGTDKPQYRVADLHTELLPSLAPIADTPPWEEVEALVKLVQLEHIAGAPGSIIRPEQHLYYYAPENGGRRAVVALRLMIDEPLESRRMALTYYVQGGIDMVHALKEGQVWGAGGGEYPGMKLIMLFAAVMLDEPDLVSLVSGFEAYEEESVSYGVDGQALWGHLDGYHPQEEGYWSDVVNELLPAAEPSRKTLRDPYGYIDGGIVPGTGYQICCTIQSFKGTSLVMQLMPVLKTPWDLPALHDYADRMVEHGALAQPDPCAPPDAADIAAGIGIADPGSNYGITFGPDGAGGCIADADPSDGTGRFPLQDGVEQDPQSYHGSSPFMHAMWAAYRASAP
jgi:hypothetical protein